MTDKFAMVDALVVTGRVGFESLATVLEHYSALLIGPVFLTPSGARYLFQPAGEGSRDSVVPGCAWVAATSYADVRSLPSEGFQWIAADEPLPEVPQWLRDLLRYPLPIDEGGGAR
jgi:hypothetical protein